MSRKSPGVVPLALAATFLAGCHHNAALLSAKPPVSVASANLNVALQTTPRVVSQMDPVTFTILLSDRHRHPVEGATASADLAMPAMEMGRNTVVLRPHGPGVYSGVGRFSMAGAWTVTVTAKQGPERADRTFPMRVR